MLIITGSVSPVSANLEQIWKMKLYFMQTACVKTQNIKLNTCYDKSKYSSGVLKMHFR